MCYSLINHRTFKQSWMLFAFLLHSNDIVALNWLCNKLNNVYRTQKNGSVSFQAYQRHTIAVIQSVLWSGAKGKSLTHMCKRVCFIVSASVKNPTNWTMVKIET